MRRLTDEDLVERCRDNPGSARSSAALAELFERHRTKVAAWCLRMTGDPNSAADLGQEIFIKAFQRLDAFGQQAKFTTWLYSIARNHCLDELRAMKTRPQETPHTGEDFEDLSLGDLSSEMERDELQQLLRRLMQESLDEAEHRVMTLHYVHEMPLDSVTRILGLTNPSGAKALIVSAKRKLRRAYERWKSSNAIATGSGNG